MMESLLKRIENNRKAHARWIALVLCLSMLVSLGTFAGFHKNAIAKVYTKDILDCPYAAEGAEAVAHVHNDDCYDGETLVCTLPELEAHTHSDECFVEQQKYVCGLEENPGHQHGDGCFAAREVNICDLEENPGHEHTGTCYNENGALICTMEAGEGAHTHTPDCFTTEWDLVCEIPEGEGAHTHTEDCSIIERTLICNKPELPVHAHDAGCIRTIEWTEGEDEPLETELPVNAAPEMPVSDPNADLETDEDWERDFEDLELSGNWARDLIRVAATQQGHGESQNNFEAILNDAGDAWVRHGYTRYGAWYGYPYAEWSAMFVSFCLRYAGIPAENVPNNPTSAYMAESFSMGELFAGRDYIPAVGDLIFFDTKVDDELENIDHMGIVYYVDAENGIINTVEGDRADIVTTFAYYLDDEQIVGYGILPQNPYFVPSEEEVQNEEIGGFIVMTVDDEVTDKDTTDTEEATVPAVPMPAQSWERTAGGIKVSVEAPEGAFPENTRIAVTPVNGSNLKDAVSDAVNGEVLEVQAVDITFFDAEGREIEPAVPIRVSMIPAETEYAEEKANVVHVDIAQQTAELIEQAEGTETDNTEVVFDAEAFTIYAIVYTYHVDFEYEVDGKVYTSSMPGAEDMPLNEIVKGLNIVNEEELETFLSKIASVTSTNEEVAVVTEDRSVRVLKDGDAQIVITMQDGAKFKLDVKAEGETSIETENVAISTVNDLYLPEKAEAKAEVVDGEEAIAAVQRETGEETEYTVFDISLENVTAEDYKEGFEVEVALESNINGKNFRLYHVHDGETTDITESLKLEGPVDENGVRNISGFSFHTDGFSEFVLSYNVDFHYTVNGKTYDFSIPGGGYVSFEKLAEVLGLATYSAAAEEAPADTEAVPASDTAEEDADTAVPLSLSDVVVSEETRRFVAEVENLAFSSPELVWVGKAEAETTVGTLKTANGLEVEYSEELTEEQIAEINAQTVEAGDWALISMQPFLSEESLTVTMKNGDIFTILVTDGQIKKIVIMASGEAWEITVTYGEDAQIPDGAELKVREILPEDEEYDAYYYQASMVALGDAESQGVSCPVVAGAHLFDIEIRSGEEKVEPAAPVRVDIRLVGAKADLLSVVHFAEEGPEAMTAAKREVPEDDALLADTEADEKVTSAVTFQTEAFSVYTVVSVNDASALVSGGPYALVNQNGPGIFAVGENNANTSSDIMKYALTDTTMTADDGSALKGKVVYLDTSVTPNLVGGDVTEWYFENVSGENGKYRIYTKDASGNPLYIKSNYDGVNAFLRLDASDGDHFKIDTNDGKVRIYLDQGDSGRWYITNMGDNPSYFREATGGGNNNSTLFTVGKLDPDYEEQTAKKVSAADWKAAEGNTGKWDENDTVIIYRRIEHEDGSEELYAIATDGSLIPVYDGGDSLYYHCPEGKNLNWHVVLGASGYYISNVVPQGSSEATVYLAPSVTNGTWSSASPLGLTLGGMGNEYGTTIENWDQAAYAYAGLHVDATNAIPSCLPLRIR